MNILFWAAGVSTTVSGAAPSSYTTDNTFKDPNVFDARGVAYEEANAAKDVMLSATADLYLSFQYAVDTVGSYYATGEVILVPDVMKVDANTSEQLVVYINEAGSWVNKGSIGTGDTNVRFDVIYERSVSGKIEVWIDGALQGSYSGDTTTVDYPATASYVRLGAPRATGSTVGYACAIFQADASTLGVEAVQNSITADGTHTDFEGNDFEKINNLGIDDATLIASKVVGDKSTFVTSDVPAAYSVGYDIVAVGVGVRASSGGVSSPDLALMIKDGANEVESSTITMNGNKEPRIGIFHTAPDAGAWTVAKANSAEYGVTTK